VVDKALREEITSILRAASHMTLATVRSDGFPQATTVSLANEGLTIFFGCREGSQKAANLARNGKVSVAISLPFTRWDQIRGLSAGGIAHRIADDVEARKVSKLLLERSPETVEFAEYGMRGVQLYKIAPKVISVLDYRVGIGHSTLCSVGEVDR
jgi:hypothetical protein